MLLARSEWSRYPHRRSEIWPAGNFERFITQVFESTRNSGKGRPRPFDAAFLAHRYRTEFETLVVPMPVRKIDFPA